MPADEDISDNLGKGPNNPVRKTGKEKKGKTTGETSLMTLPETYFKPPSPSTEEAESDAYIKGIKDALKASAETLQEKFKKIFVARFCIEPQIDKDVKLKSLLERSHHLTTNEWITLTQKHFNAYGGNTSQL